MSALQEGLPVVPDVDQDYLETIDEDSLSAMFRPSDLGKKMGGEWVKTADIKLIHAAAYRLTSNEQMEKLSRAYRQMLEGGEYEDAHDVMDNIDLQIYPPTELKGEEEAIADYFKDVSLQYYVFREMAKEVDGSEIDGCRESNRELGSDFCFSEIPNHEFRRFEDGWTKAVRKFHMSYLQECRKAGCR